ncbi:MAG: hypothetical protein HKP58_17320 [Desulfatitalea sp.]|nr:hypothetical protein [Desulfatitalea sp.]
MTKERGEALVIPRNEFFNFMEHHQEIRGNMINALLAKGSRKNNFTFSCADPSHPAALQKYGATPLTLEGFTDMTIESF